MLRMKRQLFGRISSLVYSPLVLVLGTAGNAAAVTPTFIANGLAPPNPENVIRGPDDERRDALIVTNRGCFDSVDCLIPLEPTTVHLIGKLRYYFPSEGSVLRIFASSSVKVFRDFSNGKPNFQSGIRVYDKASLIVNDGVFRNIEFKGSSTGVIRGGFFIGLEGFTRYRVRCWDKSRVWIKGGNIGPRIWANGSSQLTVEGGIIHDGIEATGSAWVTVTGGIPASEYWVARARDSSQIEFVGRDFAVDGVPIGYGTVPVSRGRLTGTLVSGEPLDVDFGHEETSWRGEIITTPRATDRADLDIDGVPDRYDNCPDVENPGQEDRDLDGLGDACNDILDWDGDEYQIGHDTCPLHFDLEHVDTDGNMRGDLCNDEFDRDGDEFEDENDVCPDLANPLQIDSDGDTRGDLCDQFPDDEFNLDAQPMLELATAWLASAEAERDQLSDTLEQTVAELASVNTVLAQTEADLASVNAALAQAELDLVSTSAQRDEAISALEGCRENPPFLDADLDGEHDATDACPGTASGEAVDASGCSADQFCASVVAHPGPARLGCAGARWESGGSLSILCQYDPSARSCVPLSRSDTPNFP